ncbi:hypothetical protein BASA81_003514 [Batrachochytrium salamandrivorans]|nr:hypothetical protein BASA81_003514 [Batrachochytrium salamandrivorans]
MAWWWLFVLLAHCARAGEDDPIPLKLDVELRNQQIMAPGHQLFLLTSEGILPYETVEMRISHLSLPPVKFSFEVYSLADHQSQAKPKRKGPKRRRLLRGRRRLDTEILQLTAGKSGMLLDGTRLPAVVKVSCRPTGITTAGLDSRVLARFNLVAERKVIASLLPHSAWKMILTGSFCLFVSAFFYVRMVFKFLRKGDELVSASSPSSASSSAAASSQSKLL